MSNCGSTIVEATLLPSIGEGDKINAPCIAITTGEPAGIGPEISIVAALVCADRARSILIGDGRLLASRAHAAGLPAALVPYVRDVTPPAGALEVLDIALAAPCAAGKLATANARYVLALLDRAIDGAMGDEFAAIVTAPVQKSVINDAGVAFTGHTEYFATRTGAERVVMMLAGSPRDASHATLRVALATTHLALKDVPAAITLERLTATLAILAADLRDKFGIAAPRMLVAGLNPHAGEGGYLGREEIDVIIPAIEAARASGLDARGPLPADTLFQPKILRDCDAVLAMYHDQGLPVLKYATFGHGVNITLGLPIVRTSVDHGTALDLAAHEDKTQTIDSGSMIAALGTALDMAVVRALRAAMAQ